MQIYFRKLGGAQVDTPDLGPVTKLGMGRRQGPVVTPPKAATSLPEFGGGALAAELGAPGQPAVAQSVQAGDSRAVEPEGMNDSRSSGQSGDGDSGGIIQPSEADNAEISSEEIVGGLSVVEADMEGVAKEELQYLMKRCKRQKQTA